MAAYGRRTAHFVGARVLSVTPAAQENGGPRKRSILRSKAARADVIASSRIALLQEPAVLRQHMKAVTPERQLKMCPSGTRITPAIGTQARYRTHREVVT